MKSFLVAALTAVTLPALAETPSSAAFKKLTSLVGTWEGLADGKTYQITYKMTGAGSALVETQFVGSPYEMVTVYTMDGPKLVMTHYCAAHNQPHLKFVPGKDPNSLAFDFVSVSNLKAKSAYMRTVVHKFLGPDHIVSTWTSGPKDLGGKTVLDVKRVKAVVK